MKKKKKSGWSTRKKCFFNKIENLVAKLLDQEFFDGSESL
jgi:hypothetical protein